MHLRDRSAQTICTCCPLRQKLQIKLSTSPTHRIQTPGQPVPALTLYHQEPGRVATEVPMFMSLEWLNMEKSPQHMLESVALTTKPMRRSSVKRTPAVPKIHSHHHHHHRCSRPLLEQRPPKTALQETYSHHHNHPHHHHQHHDHCLWSLLEHRPPTRALRETNSHHHHQHHHQHHHHHRCLWPLLEQRPPKTVLRATYRVIIISIIIAFFPYWSLGHLQQLSQKLTEQYSKKYWSYTFGWHRHISCISILHIFFCQRWFYLQPSCIIFFAQKLFFLFQSVCAR